MTHVVVCPVDGTVNPVGAISCSGCNVDIASEPLKVLCPGCSQPNETGLGECVWCATALTPALARPATIAARVASTSRLVVAVNGSERPNLAFDVPVADFEPLLLGRDDISGKEPTIADIKLDTLVEPVKDAVGESGYPFSRRQARLRRSKGRLILTPEGGAPTFVRRVGGDYERVAPGDGIELAQGDRVQFGTVGGGLVLVVR